MDLEKSMIIMNDRQIKTRWKMIGMMFEHDFMIRKIICDTFVFTKRGSPGSDQALLNTLDSGNFRRDFSREIL